MEADTYTNEIKCSTGIFFRNIRIKSGISQEKVADLIGLNQSTYSRIESDLIKPKFTIIIKLCKLFNTNINDLF